MDKPILKDIPLMQLRCELAQFHKDPVEEIPEIANLNYSMPDFNNCGKF
jgi:hypothetical protein